MSELTTCNYCSYREIKERDKGKKVELRRDEHGWQEVFVAGESAGVIFMEITDRCVC